MATNSDFYFSGSFFGNFVWYFCAQSMNIRAFSLYRRLLKYSKELYLTDRDYFCDRVRAAFRESSQLNQRQIEDYFNVNFKKF